ncbi:MAG: hypothetical protein FJW38_05125 [Acidobacteria bacterium]|nr:hypothetical protein [Acidobacteriota bacterium]
MVDNSIPIQLCVQGGAAKIALLIGVMEAVEHLQAEGVIRVTRVAGTSAGAIAGAFLAAKVPMDTVRQRLGSASLEEIVPERWAITRLALMARGKPVWRENRLRQLLAEILRESAVLKDGAKKLDTFADIEAHCGVNVCVIASSLTDSSAVVFKDTAPIVNSILSSAALPFFFRAQSSAESTIVDGGLCENLPADQLTDDPKDGPIVAISFRRTAGTPPESVQEYSLAVISASVDHSVDRAQQQLAARAAVSGLPHSAYLLEPKVDSFDFKKAVKDGLGKLYEEFRDDAIEWLRKFAADRRNQIDRDAEAEQHKKRDAHTAEYYRREMPKNLAKLYAAQHEPIAVRWSYGRLEVTVSSGEDQVDRLNHRAEFYTLDQPKWCHRLPLVISPNGYRRFAPNWEVFGPDDKAIPFYHMVMDEDGKEETLEWLICFENALPPNTGPYRLVLVEDAPCFMDPTRRGEKDDLFISFNKRSLPIDKIEVIAYLPESLDHRNLSPMNGAEKFEPLKPFELTNRPMYSRGFGLRGFNVDADRWGMYLEPEKSMASGGSKGRAETR